ncbi:MAG: hypothetical protein OXU61_11355, partial [Gammaproteobacteria bacterium]|nr:hypothetical protein [Gammaproteobacteria bacterium]
MVKGYSRVTESEVCSLLYLWNIHDSLLREGRQQISYNCGMQLLYFAYDYDLPVHVQVKDQL